MNKAILIFILVVVVVLIGFVAFKKDASAPSEEVVTTDETTMQDETSQADGPALSGTGAYELDTEASTLNWEGKKIGGGHTGTLTFTTGSLELEGGVITSGEFVVDMNSMTSDNDKVTGHLLSDDFFSAEQFPEARLVFTKVAFNPENPREHMITAVLTMKGASNEIEFTAEITEDENGVITATAPITVDRTRWGVNWGSQSITDEILDTVIDDNFTFTVDATLTSTTE